MNHLGRRNFIAASAAMTAWGMLAGAKSPRNGTGKISEAPRFRGVVYDVGLNFSGEGFSIEQFDPALVRYDLTVIKNTLHANAVRIEGEEIYRLVTASRIAHDLGMSVFFNPWKMNADAVELRSYYAEAAVEAEKLKQDGVDIIYVTGCEYPIFNKGIFPGDTLAERLAWLSSQLAGFDAENPVVPQAMRNKWPELNVLLKSFVEVIRPKFSGPVTYAATQLEEIDWSIFDIVGVDHYRGAESDEKYVAALDQYRTPGKPLVVMEVGCCAYVGGAAAGGGGFMVLEGRNPDGTARFKDGVIPTRSETEQADYVETQVRLLSQAPVDGLFIYVFSMPNYPVGEGVTDFDMVSYSIVKTFPASDSRSKKMPPWAPKEAFHRLAASYGELAKIAR